jgi:hypothetical protein
MIIGGGALLDVPATWCTPIWRRERAGAVSSWEPRVRQDTRVPRPVTHLVVVGVDGAGRTHRLKEIAEAAGPAALQLAAPLDRPGELAAHLAAGRTQGLLVLVDDVHRLAGDELAALAAAARQGVAMVIARRPDLDRRELAELDEAVAARGGVELLAPLDLAGVTTLVAQVTGRPAPPQAATAIWAASAGLPAIAAALAASPAGQPGVPPPALVARVQWRRDRLRDEPR